MSSFNAAFPPKYGIGTILTLISATAFALNTPLAPFFYNDGGNPATLSMVRSAVAAMAAFGVFLFIKERPSLPKSDLGLFVLMAASLFAQGFCYLSSVSYIPVSLAALLFFSWPLFVAIIAPVLSGNRPSFLHLLCFFAAFIGLGIALGPNLNQLDWRGIAFALSGGLFVATYIMTVGYVVNRGHNALNIAFMANFITVILGALSLPIMGGLSLPPVASDGAWALVGVSFVYVLGIFTQLAALKHIPSTLVAMIYNVEPVISIAVAALLLSEILGMREITGCILVIGALVAYSGVAMRSK